MCTGREAGEDQLKKVNAVERREGYQGRYPACGQLVPSDIPRLGNGGRPSTRPVLYDPFICALQRIYQRMSEFANQIGRSISELMAVRVGTKTKSFWCYRFYMFCGHHAWYFPFGASTAYSDQDSVRVHIGCPIYPGQSCDRCCLDTYWEGRARRSGPAGFLEQAAALKGR